MKSQHEQHVDFSQVEVVTHKWKVLIDISWSKQQHHRHCTIWFAEVAQNSCDDENQHQTNFHRNEKWMFSLHSHFHLCALMWKNGQFAALFVWYSSWPGSQIYHDNTAVVNNVWHMKREWFLSVDLTLKYFSVFAKKKQVFIVYGNCRINSHQTKLLRECVHFKFCFQAFCLCQKCWVKFICAIMLWWWWPISFRQIKREIDLLEWIWATKPYTRWLNARLWFIVCTLNCTLTLATNRCTVEMRARARTE